MKLNNADWHMELLPFQISWVIMLPYKADTYENSMAAKYILKRIIKKILTQY